MNLKTACMIALIIVMVSLPVNLLGLGLCYIPVLSGHIQWQSLISIGTSFLIILLNIAGLLVFLAACIRHMTHPAANMKPMYILAGCLVLLSALISAASGGRSILVFFQHMPLIRAAVYAIMFAAGVVSGICMGIFILMQNAAKPVLKTLAAVTIAATAISCCMIIIFTFTGTWQSSRWIMIAGSLMATSGFLIRQLALILFLLIYVITPDEMPEQAAADSIVEPAL